MIKKIISGGQTGADQGALHGARVAGVATGGTAPKGWQTELGPAESHLKYYNLCQSQNSGYAARTLENILAADGTLILGDIKSSGSALTFKLCVAHNMPHMFIPWNSEKSFPLDTYMLNTKIWINMAGIETLNIAGNRESRNPGIHIAVKNFVTELITNLRSEQSP